MGVMPHGRLMQPGKWMAPAVLALGSLVLLAATLHPWAGRSGFEFGLLYLLSRYDQALPLVGLGLVMAQVRLRLALLCGALFAAALVLGGALESAVAAATAAHGDLFRYIPLLAPACCVIIGLTLVSPRVARAWLLPLVSLLVGVVLGLEINLNDPSFGGWWFAGGAVLSGAWFIATPLLLWHAFSQGWFPIAGRILGSWMIAIGVMLGALPFIPLREIPAPASTEVPAPRAPALGEPPAVLGPPPGEPLGLPSQVY